MNWDGRAKVGRSGVSGVWRDIVVECPGKLMKRRRVEVEEGYETKFGIS